MSVLTLRSVQLGIIRSPDQDFFQCLLWGDGAVPVNPAASKEAVTHHGIEK